MYETIFSCNHSIQWDNRRFNILCMCIRFPILELVRENFVLCRPVGRGGVRGVRSNPTFDLQKILQLYILSVLPFESGLLVSLLSRITAVQTSLVTAMRVCSLRTSAKRARKLFTLLRWKDAREYTCVNKSLVLAPESCPSSDVTPSAVLRILVPPLVQVQSQLA